MRPGSTITLKICYQGQKKAFLIKFSQLTGANDVGYTDQYAITPHGDEYTAHPDGTVDSTGCYPPFKGSKPGKLAGQK